MKRCPTVPVAPNIPTLIFGVMFLVYLACESQRQAPGETMLPTKQQSESRPNVLCVKRSRNISVLGSSHNTTTVWENGDFIVLEVEPEQELIELDIPEWLQTRCQLLEV